MSDQVNEPITDNEPYNLTRIAHEAAWVAALAALPVLFLCAGNGDFLAAGDNYIDIHALNLLIFRDISKGVAPLWNPFLCGGMPLAGYGNVSVFYPLNWLYMFLSPAAAFNALMLLSYFMASVGMYLFARTWEYARPAAFTSALCFAYGCFMLGWLHSMEAVGPAVWLGWLLFAIEKLRRSLDSRRKAGIMSVVAGAFLWIMAVSGHPQIMLFGAMSASVYVLYFVLARKSPISFLGWALVSAAIGAMLSAPHLLPGLTLAAESWRGKLTYEHFSSAQFSPWQFLGSVFFFGTRPEVYFSAYLGIAPVLLIAVAAIRRRRHPLTPLSLGLMFCAMMLALAPFTGLDRLLFHVPVYNLFGFHARHTLELCFFGALLAGLGLDELVKTARGPFGSRKGLVLLVLSVAGAAVLLKIGGIPIDRSLLLGPAIAVCIIAAIHLATVRMAGGSGRSIVLGAAAALLLVEPWISFIRPAEPFNESRNAPSESVTSDAFFNLEKDHNPPRRIFSLLNVTQGNWKSIHYGSQGNLGMAAGVPNATGYHPSMLRRYKNMMDVDHTGWPEILQSWLNASNRAPDLMAARYISYDPDFINPYYEGDREIFSRIEYSGIEFADPLWLTLKAGESMTVWMPRFKMGAVALVSNFGEAGRVEQGAPVARLSFTDRGGGAHEAIVKAGEDTAVFNHETLSGALHEIFSFQNIPFYGLKNWYLKAGKENSFERVPFKAKALVLFSYLVRSDEVRSGAEAGRIELYSPDGSKQVLYLKAGENTADWAIEDAGRKFMHVSPALFRHMPPVEGTSVNGRDYPAFLSLAEPMEVSRVRIVSPMDGRAVLVIEDATLVGESKGEFSPLYYYGPPAHERPPYFPVSYKYPASYHEYFSKLDLGGAFEPETLKIEYLLPQGYLNVSRLTLIDSASKSFDPISFVDMALSDVRRFRPVMRSEYSALVENLDSMPRAWLASEALVMPLDQIAYTVQNGVLPDGTEFDPSKTVLIETPPPPNPDVSMETSSTVPASDRIVFNTYSANRFSLDAACSGARWLVLSEVYYPGWTALVDGKPWPVMPAYGMLRAMILPPGYHRVAMRFSPPYFRKGCIVGLGGVALIMVVLLYILIPAGKRKQL